MKLSEKDRERLAKLADPARTHRELAKDAAEPRDRAIYDAYVGGATIKEIAGAVGCSVSTVHRVIVKETVRRQPAISVAT